ncbi:MAG TPA: SDR family oxidoreductase [Candidatus Limnocylindria bacterium]|nr:SDR family oxidoreductase [Candidatus Limnocylindria bacterium]
MRLPISEQVVVITGASQGIGRETALEMARQGAKLVLAARNEEALGELAHQVERLGGEAEVVPTDVAEHEQLANLGDRATERFGRIDTWVNDAAVSVYSRFDEMTPEEVERVIRVNLLGQMFGSQVAISHMKPRRQGRIVNIGSALSERAIPLQSAYVASKHGVQGFSEALRLEMEHERRGIEVVVILPSSINTPLFNFARSKMGVKPMPVPPVYEPRVVAQAICHAAEHGGREIVAGGWGKLLILAQRLSPTLLDRYMVQGGRSFHQQKTDEPDDRRDNLFEPSTGPGSTTGDFGEGSKASSLYTSLFELHPNRKRFALGATLIAALTAVRHLGR